MKPESIFPGQKFAFACVFGLSLAVFAHAQSFSVVHNFTGGEDGGVPWNGLTAGNGGSLGITASPHGSGSASFYGTASTGGSSGYGVVFSMGANGVETVLHNFAGGTDGANPEKTSRIAAGRDRGARRLVCRSAGSEENPDRLRLRLRPPRCRGSQALRQAHHPPRRARRQKGD